jgi:hypothetical protein
MNERPPVRSYRSGMDWFAVRCVLKNQDAYEERITLWIEGK